MSSISQAGKPCGNLSTAGTLSSMIKSLVSFFKRRPITRTARIYHGDYSYDSLPDTAFYNFMNMSNITLVESGDCHIYIFEEPRYQGAYTIISPGEVAPTGKCGSMIVSLKKLSINNIQNSGKPPAEIWETNGAKYQWHFSVGYKYV